MVSLGTLPIGEFLPGSSSDVGVTGTNFALQIIASANDATDVHDIANTTHVGVARFNMAEPSSMPTDFGNMDTLSVRLRYARQAGTLVNTWTRLSVQVYRADQTTPLTDEVTIASNISHTTPLNGSVVPLTNLDTSASKAVWDAAVVVIRFEITKNMGGDALEERVYAGEFTGTYTVASASTDLVIADSAQLQATEAPTLTSEYSLTVQDSAQLQATDNVTLALPAVDLTVQDSAQLQATEAPTLTVDAISLTIQDSAQAQATDAVVLTLPGGALTETWTGVSDGTDINGDNSWSKVQESSGAGSWKVEGQRLRLTSGVESFNTARAEVDIGGVDHYVEAELELETSSNEAGVCARFSSSANTWYAAVISFRNQLVFLIRCVNGTRTTIASRAETVVAGTYTVRITVDGDQITGSFEGLADLSATDATITTGTRMGAYGRTRSLGGHFWDNFIAEVLVDSTDLVIQGSAQDQATENVTLTSEYQLTIQDSTQAQATDNVTLALAGDLVIQSSAQAQETENVTLTSEYSLTIQDSAQAQATDNVTLAIPGAYADYYEDWSGYPDSSFGSGTALDGRRLWKQGANRSPDGTRAGWRIQSGVAVAGSGDGSDVDTSISLLDYRAPAIARCLDDVGSDDLYVRATLGTAQWPDHFGLLGRMNTDDAATCYYLQVRPSNGDIRIFTIIAGAFGSLVGTASYTTTPGDVIEMRCFGTTISARVNGSQVISVTNSAVTAGHFGGVYAHNAISDSVRFTDFQTGALDGSGNPVENAPADAIPAVQYASAGVGGRVIASTRNVDLMRIVVADNSGLTSPVFTSSYAAPDSLGLIEFSPTGLSAGTQYFYGLQVDDVTVGVVRSFRTAPAGQSSFTFAISGDAGDINSGGTYIRSKETVNSPVYDRIVDRDPAFFLFAGDRYYRDYNIADVAPHLKALRDVYDNPRAGGLFDSLSVAQMWDDHDYTGISDASATGRDAAVETFRRTVPVASYLVDTDITDPVGHTFTWGRARFIIFDHRSSRTSGNILGTAQLNAVLDLIENATEEIIFLYVGVPWIAGSAPLADHWGAFTANRATIAETIEDFAKGRVVILHADAHMLAIDDGTNTQYDTGTTDPGPPLLCAAPIDSITSFKTGTYSEGFVPDPVGPRQEQYATVEVDDQGSQFVVTMRGWSVDDASETEVISHQFTVSTGDGVNLVVQDSSQAQATENVTLAVAGDLIIQDSNQLQETESIVLTVGEISLTVQDSAQLQATENVTLATSLPLIIQDSSQLQATESVSLSPMLVIQNSDQTQTTENVTLSSQYDLTIQDSQQLQATENVTLSTEFVLTIQDSEQLQATDNVILVTVPELVIEDSLQAQSTANVVWPAPPGVFVGWGIPM